MLISFRIDFTFTSSQDLAASSRCFGNKAEDHTHVLDDVMAWLKQGMVWPKLVTSPLAVFPLHRYSRTGIRGPLPDIPIRHHLDDWFGLFTSAHEWNELCFAPYSIVTVVCRF